MPKQTMGEFMATLRKANGFTQAEVAEKLNISNRTLSSWETDRTVPDILLLPSIADLYGVTVDELLRGERIQPNSAYDSGLTDKAKHSARKNRYGKFKTDINLFTGIAIGSECLIFLSFILYLFTSSPIALIVVLWVLGGAGVITSIILAFYFKNRLLVSEGVITDEDYSDENRRLAQLIKYKVSSFLNFCSLPFLFFSLLFAILLIAINPQDYILVPGVTVLAKQPYIIAISVNAVLFLLLIVISAIYKNYGFKKYATPKQLDTRTSNTKYALKIAAVCSFPVIVTAVLFAVFCTISPSTAQIIYKSDDLRQFKSHMQTLVITEKEAQFTNLTAGEYELNFPDDYKNGIFFEAGHGISGIYNSSDKIAIFKQLDTTGQVDLKLCEILTVANSADVEIVNVRYSDFKNKAATDNPFFITHFSSAEIRFNENNFEFVYTVTTILGGFMLVIFLTTTVLSAAAGFIVYRAGHKKQALSL